MKVSHDFFPGIRYKAIERNNTILEGKVSQEICVCLFEGWVYMMGLIDMFLRLLLFL